ncbi:hypothetical protein CRD60_02235 [Bifidobacterium aemilianum]|uniref:Uncharacterized protein n=2 Tax=Bifidobacterium aemilianum TaxID=2493120 RepID=A0A366K9L1_9BIFI|nr:hypothetical protein CRD60_02235 [Bifidobacterium aemilianum]
MDARWNTTERFKGTQHAGSWEPPGGFKAVNRRPVCDGFLNMELSDQPIHYHFTSCISGLLRDPDCSNFAMNACRIACMAADVLRGRRPARLLGKIMSPSCLGKLRTVAMLVENHLNSHADVRENLCTRPVVPTTIDGMFTSDHCLELCILLSIGSADYCMSMRLDFVGSRWICVLADMG